MNNFSGRGGNSTQRSCSIISPMMREKRTADVVKSVLTKVKERLLVSGPLLTEEETAITQLEQLYVTKFSQMARDPENESSNDSTRQAVNAHRKEIDQPLSLFLFRRDSDASFSNDTHLSSASVSRTRTPKDKDIPFYGSQNLWRRTWQRKKRLELRRAVEPLDLRADEANDENLGRAVSSVYDGLVLQGRPPLAAYDLLITTLRSYFARETWPDLVEVYVIQFLQNHLLLSATEIAEKYAGESRGNAPSLEGLDEFKLQALLHLHALSVDTGNTDSHLEQTLEVLRFISLSFGGSSILPKFLDEDVLDYFLDVIPRELANIFHHLDLPLPSELNAYSSVSKEKDNPNNSVSKSKKKQSNSGERAVTPTAKVEKVRVIKRPVEKTSPVEKKKTLQASGVKRMKIEPKMDDIEEVVEPPQAPVDENPVSEKKLSSPGRPKKPKLADNDGKVIAESSSSSSSSSSVLVSVRQSPRHHASTRALYSSASSSLSLLLKDPTDETNRNGSPEIPAEGNELQTDSTRLVLVKDKRGYFLKKFLHDEGEGDDNEEDHVSNETSSANQNSKKETAKTKVAKSTIKVERQKSTAKRIGKLKLTLKTEASGKKVVATVEQQKTALGSKKTKAPRKSTKNGRMEERHRIIITKTKSKGSTDSKPSFILSTSVANHSRTTEKEKNVQRSSSNRQNAKLTLEVKSPLKLSKSVPASLDKSVEGNTKSSKSKAGKSNLAYALPSYAVENYTKHVNEIRRERKRARNDPTDEVDLFYARGTRRHSIFYDGVGGDDANKKAPVSKCYSDEQMAPKNRSGRKMKSSVEVFHLANYLLNVQNENPSAPAVPKNLQQALNTPIRLYKKLRLASKNSRRRSLRQFCALKFNADEFKLSLDNGSGTSNSSTIADEDRSATETDECASLELNCGDPRATPPKEVIQRQDLKLTLTIDTSLTSQHSPRRNSVSVCAGLSNWSSKIWKVNGASDNGHEQSDSKNGYFLRRRRLFSDGHVSSITSVASPETMETRRTFSLRRRGGEFEDLRIKFADTKDGGQVDAISATDTKTDGRTRGIIASIPEKEFFVIADGPIGGVDEASGGSFLNRLTTRAGGLLQLANSSPMLCNNLASKNYAQVAADVR